MPFSIKKSNGKFKIVKKSGKVVGTSDSKNTAMKAIVARLASESGQKI